MMSSNKFAVILAKLTEVFEKGAGYDCTSNTDPAVSWESTKVVLRKTPEGLTAYVKGLDLYDVLEQEDLDLLEENDLLVDKGAALRVKLNGKETRALGIRFAQLKERAQEVEKNSSESIILRERVKSLERELRVARREREEGDVEAAFFERLLELASKRYHPTGGNRNVVRKQNKKALGGVPVLFCSDWHWDEVVDGDEIMGLNQYNREIAHKRAHRVFDKSVEILTTHMSGQHYDGIVCALGGDMSSGLIHAELRESNEGYITDTVLDLASLLAEKIAMLARDFPEVLVPCVSGNHGRTMTAWRAKGKQVDNYDYLVYRMVQNLLCKLENVRFVIPKSTDVLFSTYHIKYLLTHGDQFKSSGGMGGIVPSLKKGDYRKRKIHHLHGGYDYLMMGHWHSYNVGEGLIVNGSLKGMDEYTFQGNFEYEPARQALWIAHPDYGVGHHMAIYGDEPEHDGTEYPALGVPDMASIVRKFK